MYTASCVLAHSWETCSRRKSSSVSFILIQNRNQWYHRLQTVPTVLADRWALSQERGNNGQEVGARLETAVVLQFFCMLEDLGVVRVNVSQFDVIGWA